jgi:hypothetical protein
MKKIALLVLAAAGLGLGGCAIVPAEPVVVVGPGVVYGPGYGHRYHHRHHRHHHRHHGG